MLFPGGGKAPAAENSAVSERENHLDDTWVRDELVAYEKFKHGWNVINKTMRRGESRKAQGESELEHPPHTFQERTVFRNIPEMLCAAANVAGTPFRGQDSYSPSSRHPVAV